MIKTGFSWPANEEVGWLSPTLQESNGATVPTSGLIKHPILVSIKPAAAHTALLHQRRVDLLLTISIGTVVRLVMSTAKERSQTQFAGQAPTNYELAIDLKTPNALRPLNLADICSLAPTMS
jgi:hypothetical protein